MSTQNKNPCAWTAGKWLGLSPVPNEFAHGTNSIVVRMIGFLVRASGMAVVAHALEAVVNPTEDGTLPRTMATLQSLQHWRDIHAGILQQSMGNVSTLIGAAAGKQLGYDSALGSCRYSTIQNAENKREIDNGVLMVVIASIYGHPLPTLIDSGTTRFFVSSFIGLSDEINFVYFFTSSRNLLCTPRTGENKIGILDFS